MIAFLDRFVTGEVLVADGAMGTQLFARGVDAGQCPERVNLVHPEILGEIAASYLDAGADIVQTNTFGASPLKLAMYDLAEQTEAINRIAVDVVRQAVGDRAYVSGSCGPCGKMLEPYGNATRDDVYDGFRRQIEAMIDAGADCVCVETMTDLSEATLAVRAAKDVSPTTPVMATMTFDATPRGFFTIMGTTVEQAAKGLRDAGADVVGSNCGHGIDRMIEVARELRSHTDRPVLIQSNAGLPEMKNSVLVYPESPAMMAERAQELISIGVSIIGGCCGTTPDHVGAIRKMVDAARP